jgi:hypothetical protein
MGTSRDSFYRIKELYNIGGKESLREISRRKPIPKNRVEPQVEQAVIQMAFDYPAYGQAFAKIFQCIPIFFPSEKSRVAYPLSGNGE